MTIHHWGGFVCSAVKDTTENLYKEKLNDSFPKVALKGPNSFKFEDTMQVSSFHIETKFSICCALKMSQCTF